MMAIDAVGQDGIIEKGAKAKVLTKSFVGFAYVAFLPRLAAGGS